MILVFCHLDGSRQVKICSKLYGLYELTSQAGFQTRRLVRLRVLARRQQNQNAFPKMISVGADRSTKSGKATGYLIFSISVMVTIFHIFPPCCLDLYYNFRIIEILRLIFDFWTLDIPNVPEKYQITFCMHT